MLKRSILCYTILSSTHVNLQTTQRIPLSNTVREKTVLYRSVLHLNRRYFLEFLRLYSFLCVIGLGRRLVVNLVFSLKIV